MQDQVRADSLAAFVHGAHGWGREMEAMQGVYAQFCGSLIVPECGSPLMLRDAAVPVAPRLHLPVYHLLVRPAWKHQDEPDWIVRDAPFPSKQRGPRSLRAGAMVATGMQLPGPYLQALVCY